MRRAPMPAPSDPAVQLSLFDLPPALVERAESAEAGALHPRRVEPAATSSAPPRAEGSPAEPLAAIPRFAHPQGQREIRFSLATVVYRLRRSRRRSIGFMVGPEGLSVSAPRWVSIGEIESALHEKSRWILDKLAEQQARERSLRARAIQWGDGGELPFLGEPLVLVIDPGCDGVVLRDVDVQSLPGIPSRQLHVGLPMWASPEQVREAVQSWLQRQALEWFRLRCAHFAGRIGVQPRRLGLSAAATRWGSASADGSIRLNWRLIHFAPSVIDYVVAHELAHLREMNHGPAFWNIVADAVPGYEQARRRLQRELLPPGD